MSYFSNNCLETCLKQQATHINPRVHLLIFPYLLRRMVLLLIMTTEMNFKQEKILKFTQFCNFLRALGKNQVILKIAGRYLRLEIFLNILSRFWGFWGSFSSENFSYKKRVFEALWEVFIKYFKQYKKGLKKYF